MSLPALPDRKSAPPPPVIVSFPEPPDSALSPLLPVNVASPTEHVEPPDETNDVQSLWSSTLTSSTSVLMLLLLPA